MKRPTITEHLANPEAPSRFAETGVGLGTEALPPQEVLAELDADLDELEQGMRAGIAEHLAELDDQPPPGADRFVETGEGLEIEEAE